MREDRRKILETKLRRTVDDFLSKNVHQGDSRYKTWTNHFIRNVVNLVDSSAKKEVNVRLQDIRHAERRKENDEER